MFAPPTPEQREMLLSMIAHAPDGVTLEPLAAAVGLPADDRKLKQWLIGFADENLVYKEVDGRTPLYFAVDPESLLQAHPTVPVAPAPSVAPLPAPPIETPPAPPPPRDPVEACLGEAIPYIVDDCGLPTSAARPILRRCGRSAQLDAAAMAVFMDRAIAILTTLTEEEAATKYGIDPQQYAVWRERCRLAGEQPAPSRNEPLETDPSRSGSDNPGQTQSDRDEPPRTESNGTGPNAQPPAGVNDGGAAAAQSGTETDAQPGADGPLSGAESRPPPSSHANNRAADTSAAPPAKRMTDDRARGPEYPLGHSGARGRDGGQDLASWDVHGSTPAAFKRSFMKAAGRRVVQFAEWLIPGRLSGAEKTTLAGMAIPTLTALGQWLGAVPVVLVCAGWLLVCLLRRRGVGGMAVAGGTAVPLRNQGNTGNMPVPLRTGGTAVAPLNQGNTGNMPVPPQTGGTAVPPLSQGNTGNMPVPLRTATNWVLLVAGLVLLSGIGAGWYYWKASRVPSKEVVAAHLVKSVAPLPVGAETCTVVARDSTDIGLNLTYQIRFETTEPLYRRVDTMEYLKAHAAGELAEITAAEARLKGPLFNQLQQHLSAPNRDEPFQTAANRTASADPHTSAMGTSRSTYDPQTGGPGPALHSIGNLVLLTTQTPPGATAVCSGTLVAWKREGSWVFEGEPARVDRTRFAGEPRPAGALIFAVDLPADEARLKALLAEQAGYAARVQAAARELVAEQERDHQRRVAGFADLLRTGTLFTGTASGAALGGALRISLEIAASSADSPQVTALLRNDGGWSDARLFQGEWSVPADSETCTLMLRTGRADRLNGAGPLLEDNRDIAVTLQLRPDGTASGVPENWQLRRVAPADTATVRAGISRALPPVMAATKPGLVYRGTVSSQGRSANEVLLLRFTAQDPDTLNLEASLQSLTVASWARSFRGSVIDNTYRAGSTPIRLRSLDADRIAQAPTWSMLALATGGNGTALNLRVDGVRLIGQDDHFTYVFEPFDAAAPNRSEPLQAAPGGAGPFPSATGGSGPLQTAPNRPGPVDGSTVPPIDRSTVPPVDGSTVRPIDRSARALPPFPGSVGAYVLSDDGAWVPLPRNNSRIVQSLLQKANALFGWLDQAESWIAGTKMPDPKAVTGQWMFDGTAEVPVVSGDDVVVIYAGPLIISPAMLAKHPELAREPLMEMAPLWTLASGVRSVPLTSPVKGVFGFGPLRIPATLERPTLAITLFHCTTRLPARHYAVACGDNAYEFAVK